MSSPETQIQDEQIQPQELKPEQIKELYEKAVKEGRVEALYMLKLHRWARQGTSYIDKADFEIIFGEAEEVVIHEWDEGYPYRRGVDVIIIPKTIPVVILWFHKWDYGEDRGGREIAYIFTSEGWKSVTVE
jgi:hypothetical protein